MATSVLLLDFGEKAVVNVGKTNSTNARISIAALPPMSNANTKEGIM